MVEVCAKLNCAAATNGNQRVSRILVYQRFNSPLNMNCADAAVAMVTV